jgi:cell division protein FtsI/penicillin-binding protein 2
LQRGHRARSAHRKVAWSSPGFGRIVETDFASLDDHRQLPASCSSTARRGLYVPGSTFKVITASAALESKKYTPDSTFVDPGYCTVYGKRVNNFDTTRPFGTIDLEDALAYSVNSVFCNIGLKLGARRILDTAKRFGFYELPPLETPADERRASGLYKGRRLYYPGRLDVDPPHGFGQRHVVTRCRWRWCEPSASAG